jgi:hypothetical protein
LEKGKSLKEIGNYTPTQILNIYGHSRTAKGELDVQYQVSDTFDSDVDEVCEINGIFRQADREKLKAQNGDSG